jgi:cellulose synthase/poly-beta-1,6-N-acetylglucosamine synthase-like glycosyltransferase
MTTAWVMVLIGVATGVYAYVGYPALLLLLAGPRRRVPARSPARWPHVTITLPVFNEERVVAAALDALLALDYPPQRRQVLVVSDCCTDATDAIVTTYADRGVKLVRLARRAGKTAAENEARHHVATDIVVNTDASTRPAVHALKALVAVFEDPTVGVASGRDVSVARLGDGTSPGESGYVGYEMWVRALETRAGGIVGASGCFFASRAELYGEAMPDGLSRDFAAPLVARERGYRSVSVEQAVCYVPRTAALRQEYRRKVRTMTRGLATLFYKRRLLNPFRYGLFAWMLWSHKLARWLVPWAAAMCVAGLAILASRAAWARAAFGVGGVAGVLALAAWVWPAGRRMPRVVALPSYVVWGVLAGMAAWIAVLRGVRRPLWEPTRRDVPEAGA